MRKLQWWLLVALAWPGFGQAAEIVDMAGRRVAVPERIERVFGSAPPLNVLLHAVAPETMVGLSFPVPEEARPYFPPRLSSLPVAGGIFGMGPQMNAETVLKLKPDLALAWKSPSIDQGRIDEAFARLGIPLVYIQLDTLSDWPAALRFSGRLLGREPVAEAQAQYIEKALVRVGRLTADLPANRRPRVYYAEGPDGLSSDCHRSFHTEAIELAGGYNVYRCEPKDHQGMERVSLEQILALAPDVIVTHDRGFAAKVVTDPRWQGVRAVRDRRILLVPRWPHNWIDRPPSLMRALGIQWLANAFYPQDFPLDLKRETRDFYRRFLGVNPSDADLDRLFQ